MLEQRGFKGLAAWKVSMDLVELVYQVSSDWPEAERYGLTSQVRRAAVSIPSDIAEGHGRRTSGDFARFVTVAFGSLSELETQILIAMRLGYSKQVDVLGLLDRIHETARVVQGLYRYLKREQP